MAKNNALPTVSNTDKSSISYAPEVIAIIVGVAANEVEGVAGMVSVSGGIRSRNKNITKGIKVEVGTEEVSCDLYLNIEYGSPIQKVCQEVQESVRKAIEAMTGLHVVRVDVHVMGVSFEKENSAITAGAQKAVLTDESAEKPAEKSVEADTAQTEPEQTDASVTEEAAPEKEEVPEVTEE